MFIDPRFRRLAATLLLSLLSLVAAPPLRAQSLEITPTPFTTLIDFSQLRHPAGKMLEAAQSRPIWLESVQMVDDPTDLAQGKGTARTETVFRIRLRSMPGLNDTLLLRLFFQDKAEAHPVVTGWSETGDKRYTSPRLGAGLELLASESLVIPTAGIDYLEITTPGDGSALRQAFLASLRRGETQNAFDFVPRPGAARFTDPFEGSAADLPALPAENDTFLFGRTRAILEAEPVRLATESDPEGIQTVHFEFNLESEPLLAMVTFYVLAADPTAPLLAWANDEPVGAVAMQLPDLADPGYSGVSRPLERMRFQYAGWIRCQKVIPAKTLRAGKNTFSLQLPGEAASSVVLRKIELQLKNHWQKLDYTLLPF